MTRIPIMILKIRKFKIQKRQFKVFNKTRLKCKKTKMTKERKSNTGNLKPQTWSKKETFCNRKYLRQKDKTNYLKWPLQDFKPK